jgi:hypothetical protein
MGRHRYLVAEGMTAAAHFVISLFKKYADLIHDGLIIGAYD